jgi:NAD-dependent dihydropyrimidine dehydrogenase PreA subunit
LAVNQFYFDEESCTGCNNCVEVCQSDVFEANPLKGKPPRAKYPEDCSFCGACIEHCPHAKKGAIRIQTPFQMRGGFLK